MSSTYVQMRSGIRRDRRVARIAEAIQHDQAIIDRVCGPPGEGETAACRSMPEDIATTYAVGGLQAVWDVIQQEGDEGLAHEAESLFVRDIDADELDKQAGVIGIARAMAAENVGWLVFRDGGVEAPRILERGTNLAGSKQRANNEKLSQRRKAAWVYGAGVRAELPDDIYTLLDESEVQREIDNGRAGIRMRKELDDPDGRKLAAYRAGHPDPAATAEQPSAGPDQPAESADQSTSNADQSGDDQHPSNDQAESAEPEKPAGKKGGKKRAARASIRDNRSPVIEGKRHKGQARVVLRGEAAERFEQFWSTFDFKQDRRACAEIWAGIEDAEGGISEELFDLIIAAAQAEANARPNKRAQGLTPKYPQGWLSESRWESYQEGGEAIAGAAPMSAGDAREQSSKGVADQAARELREELREEMEAERGESTSDERVVASM